MAYYKICDKCGARLDPGESCDCEEVKERQMDFLSRAIKASPGTGQYFFRWDGKDAGHEKENVG